MSTAQTAVDKLQLKNEDVLGKRLNVEELLKDHPSRGRFRVMVFQAAARILEKRGAMTEWIDVAKHRQPHDL